MTTPTTRDKFKCICDPDKLFADPYGESNLPEAVEGCPAHKVRRTVQQKILEMYREDQAKMEHEQSPLAPPDACEKCGQPILVMAFKGTGVCGELCRKLRAGEIRLFEVDNHG